MSIKLTDGKNWKADLKGTGSLLDKQALTVTGLNIGKNWESPVNKIDPKDLARGRSPSPAARPFLLPTLP